MHATLLALTLLISTGHPSIRVETDVEKIQVTEAQSYDGRTVNYLTTSESLNEHSKWDGKSELNIRMESVIKRADFLARGSLFGGIGGIDTVINRVELVPFRDGNWIWIGNVTIIEMGSKRELVTVTVPFNLDLTPMMTQITKR
jgi:hypothetical protein